MAGQNVHQDYVHNKQIRLMPVRRLPELPPVQLLGWGPSAQWA